MLEIYLTDLAAYNQGYLVGRWIRLPLAPFELAQALSEVLTEGEHECKSSHHEEYFITDHDWLDNEAFFHIDEYEDIYALNEKLQIIEEQAPDKHSVIAFLLHENIAADLEDAIAKVDDVIVHKNQTMEDIAYEVMQELYGADLLPSIIANHIDYEGIGREFEMDGNYYEYGSDIYEYVG